MTDDRLTGVQQENVLTLLCFDSDAAKVIRGAVSPALFESRVYQDIATRAINFLDQYGEAIKDHLPDVLEEVLESKDDRKKSQLYKRTLENLYSARDGINSKFIISQLREFVHQQTLKTAILLAVEKIEAGKTAEAEVELEKGMRAQLQSFDVGTVFTDTQKSLSFFDKGEEGIPTGIKALDDIGINLAPGTLFLFIAPAKKGKSWFATHLAKFALLQRKKVLIITLEMSEQAYMQRVVQCMFSVSKREANVQLPLIRRAPDGTFVGIDFDEVKRPTLGDEGVRTWLAQNIADKFKNRTPLIIKNFPTGTLTIAQYKAYLDQLERHHKFVPDVVLFDYPDLMETDTDNIRVSLGNTFKLLRGIAVERNHALFAPTQGNRSSADARTTTDTHVAEDYSKIATADTVLTYSQTIEEKRLGLARLYVANSRNEADKVTVLITQAYPIGQFCIDSMRMMGDYWTRIDAMGGARPRTERAEE